MAASGRGGYLRVNGLLLMAVLVGMGFGAGALYYSYKEPRVREALDAELRAAPTTDEGRVEKWMEFFEPQVHHNLSEFARASEDQPWIVTHAVDAGDGGEPLVYGLDVSHLPKEGLLAREGLAVVLTLDPVRLLGRADDLVIVRGRNVDPREVERVLKTMPGVEDACVLGVDGPDGPRSILRAVVAAPSTALDYAQVVTFCRTHLAEHKVPRSVILVPDLPRTDRGKIDRAALAALAG